MGGGRSVQFPGFRHCSADGTAEKVVPVHVRETLLPWNKCYTFQKFWRFFAKILLMAYAKIDHNLGFLENRLSFAENRRKV
jgi:hypothetical protein